MKFCASFYLAPKYIAGSFVSKPSLKVNPDNFTKGLEALDAMPRYERLGVCTRHWTHLRGPDREQFSTL